MASYLTTSDFRLGTLLPSNVLDDIEADSPGWLEQQIAIVSAAIDARLAKRYAVPFAEPYPIVAAQWVNHIVSLNAWLKRGMSSSDESFAEYKAKHDRAYEEMREAADSQDGLFELPRIVSGLPVSGIARGFPRSYSEQSPYVGFDRQSRIARGEDSSGNGSQQ